jgi:hypothetical protein
VSLDEVSSAGSWPARAAVQTFGPAYRYPSAGWIYLHIEGKPVRSLDAAGETPWVVLEDGK